MLNPYQPQPAKIIEIKDQTKRVKLFRLEPADKGILNFQPGQFVLVSLPGFGQAPFAPCNRSLSFEPASPTEGRESESRSLNSRLSAQIFRRKIWAAGSNNKNDFLEICVRQTGTVTTKLHSLGVGDEIYLRGPYGRGFALSIQDSKCKNLLLVAGGIGLIPLRPIILQAEKLTKEGRKIQVFYGTKTIDDLLFRDEYEEWKKHLDLQITLDEKCPQWTGCLGMITELFNRVKVVENALAWLCGPPIMYKFVLEKLKEHNFKDEDIYLSLERRMHCGLGICQHCAIGSKYVCRDGPVFRYSEIKEIPGVI